MVKAEMGHVQVHFQVKSGGSMVRKGGAWPQCCDGLGLQTQRHAEPRGGASAQGPQGGAPASPKHHQQAKWEPCRGYPTRALGWASACHHFTAHLHQSPVFTSCASLPVLPSSFLIFSLLHLSAAFPGQCTGCLHLPFLLPLVSWSGLAFHPQLLQHFPTLAALHRARFDDVVDICGTS